MTTPLLLRAAEIIEREEQRRSDDSPNEKAGMLDIARQLRERHEKEIPPNITSDTPRTDDAFCDKATINGVEFINIRFARQLEWELARKRKEKDEYEEDAVLYRWLIQNLPQFHSILFDGATPLMYRGRYLKTPDEIEAALKTELAKETP